MDGSISSVLLRVLICFLAGTIPFAVLAMMGTGMDIRQVGSGNPGFNNVLRVSKPRAVLTLIGDMGKGFLAVWLVYIYFHHQGDGISFGWLYGSAVVLGHCFSPFLKFNGGKGIATSGGVMLVLYLKWAIVAIVYFAVVRVALGKLKCPEAGMIASISTWILFTGLMVGFVGLPDATCSALMTLFLAWRHKKNFENLFGLAASGGRSLNPADRKT